jgi:hypothetical protein
MVAKGVIDVFEPIDINVGYRDTLVRSIVQPCQR